MSSDSLIFLATCLAFWLGTKSIVAIKAKAFNEGYKRGRASLNVREIVK